MAQLDFYALKSDVDLVLQFVFEQTDCRVFEAYSRPGHELREFSSVESLRDSDVFEANHERYFLRFLSRTVNSEPIIKEFTLTKTGQKRCVVNSPAMFQIDQGHVHDTENGALYWSTFSHWNEAGAKQRSNHPDELLLAVDWKRMRQISGQIQRHIKNKLAVAKVRARLVLPGAFEGLNNSLELWGGPGLIGKSSDKLEVY